MATTSTRTLRPIIRDRAGTVGPIPAAIAAITGQPLTAVVRMLSQSIAALKGMSGVHGEVSPEDASHVALHRFGYQPHRLYADHSRHPGDLLGTYARSPGPCERLLAICESGLPFAFLGDQVGAWTSSAPTALSALVGEGTLKLDAPVRFAMTVKAPRGPSSPLIKFLETVAIPAFAIADAYNIKVMPVGWPYWSLSFPSEMADGGPGSSATLVCGEHELLSVINERVRQLQRADETTEEVMARLVGRPATPSDSA